MTADWEAVVVGAGPAGAVAARELARRGLSVLLADRKPFPRAKVCGGCLNVHGVGALETAGLQAVLAKTGAVPLQSLRLQAGGQELALPLSGGAALERGAFDQALVREAVAAGARFRPGAHVLLAAVETGLRRVTLRSQAGDEETSAKVIVAADGLGSATLDDGLSPPSGSRLGAGALFENEESRYESGVVHMTLGRSGYVGLVRLGDGRLNVAAAFDPAALRATGGLAEAARNVFSSAGCRAPSGLDAASWTGTPALTRQPRSPAAERLFAVGDASGYVEPFTGEGMAWALADALAVGELACEASERWRPELAGRWARRHRERTRLARWRCRAISGLLRRPRACGLLLGLLRTRPAWGRALAQHVHGVGA